MSRVEGASKLLAVSLALSLIGACTPAVAQPASKPTVHVDSYLISPKSFEDLWDSSTLVAKVIVQSSKPFGTPSASGYPRVFTRYEARVARVFKGEAKAGDMLEFASAGGVLETSDYVIENTSHARFLEAGRSYVVFLRPLEQIHGLIMDYNHFGAFEIRESRVIPVGGGSVSEQWRNASESQMADALERMRIR
jgi:hypothetical protein